MLWQNGSVDESERDVYEYLLTKTEIQGGLNTVNSAVTKQKAEARSECHTQSRLY